MKSYLARTLSATAFFSAVLVLSACATKTRTLTVGVGDQAAVQAAEERADEAEAALTALRESLAAAQNALGAATNTEQRNKARGAVIDSLQGLENVQQNLAMLPDGDDKTAANTALTAVRTALSSVVEALGAANAAFGSGGTISFTSMHTSLHRAQALLDDAQTKITEALEANPTDAIETLLSQAQGTLTAAQVSLVPRLFDELDTAEARAAQTEAERDEARTRADSEKERADTYDPRVSLAQALEPREPRFVPRGEAEITRTPRTDTGEAGWEKLDIATDGVAWADGKMVAAANGGLAATDELPLRGVTLRAAGRHPIKIQGDDGTPTSYSNTDGVVTSSLQLSADGPTFKFGGAGVIYYDIQRRFDIGANQDDWWRFGPDGKLGDADASAGGAITDAHATDLGLEEASGQLTADQATMLQGWATDNNACWQEDLSLCGAWNHDDLTIAFGAPSQSPHGDPSYYWKARVPLTEAQRGQRLPNRMQADDPNADGRPEELGTYELWLSSYGGLDTGADADDAGDDSHRYLEYAAYGLFMVFDNVKATPSFTRPQAFAFGYDAFRDADGMRTTDVSTSIAATFEGHTMARALINHGDENFITLSGSTPLRGDVTLNACIGGSGCTGDGIPATANRISGMISGLEELRHDEVWIPYGPAAGGIPMEEGEIAADGSFGGQLDHPRLATDPGEDEVLNTWDFDADIRPGSTHPSKYGGNLYGPRDGLEAAGWWHMQADHRARALRSSIIGSFGAKCVEGCVTD